MKIEIKIIRNSKPKKWIPFIKGELKHFKDMAIVCEKSKSSHKDFQIEFWDYIEAYAKNKKKELEELTNKKR